MNDGQKNAKLLVKRLTAARLTLSTAESCTGGLIAKLITDVAGSSAVFAGGCVTYTNEVKHALLGVEQQIFDQYTEVSEPCAKAMAAGVRAKLNTHIGVSTTGYAGPGGGTEKDPVGTVYIAVATPERTVCRRIQAPKGSTRGQVRHLAATIAIRMIAEELN
ncbi:MAG: CinA family protein [Clostridia bacterium]|nr:CinA family protein [Clostridia bacterium]